MIKNYNPEWSVSDHQQAKGKSFISRYQDLTDCANAARDKGVWQYFRSHNGRVSPKSTVIDELGREFSGINIGSQDYLGLANHPDVHAAAIESIKDYGVHSSGSAPMGGGSVAAKELERSICENLDVAHALLFPTGWAAGYGAIVGIVRPYDYVVMDALSHNCLQHGAYAATPNVKLFIHNSVDSLKKRLSRIRANDPDAAILVVFETLYSMDSDSPDIAKFVEAAKQYDAEICIDIAHDFGVLGTGGRGVLADSLTYDQVDMIIGSFSKVFASIGGFLASPHESLIGAAQGFSGSYTFSNFLIPPQIAAAQKAMEITFSDEGEGYRKTILKNCRIFRDEIERGGLKTYGSDSAMIIVSIDSEHVAREAYKMILERGVILNCIEYPAVRKGEARFRVQITPHHSVEDLVKSASIISDSVRDAEKLK